MVRNIGQIDGANLESVLCLKNPLLSIFFDKKSYGENSNAGNFS